MTWKLIWQRCWPSRALPPLYRSASLSLISSLSSCCSSLTLSSSPSSSWLITSGRVVLLPPRGLFLLCRPSLCCCFASRGPSPDSATTAHKTTSACQQNTIGNKNVPIQLAQCWFSGLAISNAKIQIYIFSTKIYGSNFIKQHSQTVMVWN